MDTLNSTIIPEVVRYYQHGRYLLGEVRGHTDVVVLARLIGPRQIRTRPMVRPHYLRLISSPTNSPPLRD